MSFMRVIRTTPQRPTCNPAPHGSDRHRHRRTPPLRRGRCRSRRARRGECLLRARPFQRDHGPVRVRQVDADAHPRRARPTHVGLRGARRRRDLGPRRRRPDQAAPRQARLHLPVLQPDPGPHRRGEHRAAALDRRPQGRRRVAAAHWSTPSAWATGSPTARPSCRAASSSASRWRARWSRGRPWCSPTSPPATSTPSRATRCCRLLRQSVDDLGQTVVMVTHDPEAAVARRPPDRAARRADRARRPPARPTT